MAKERFFLMSCVLFICWVFLSCGCVSLPAANTRRLLRLELNQQRDQTLKIMGRPSRCERYDLDGTDIEVWYYRVTPKGEYPDREDEFVSMVFKNGRLSGWGRKYFEWTIKYKMR